MLVGVDVGIERLSQLVLDPQGEAHTRLDVALDVIFVGAAVLIAIVGAIVVVIEAVRTSVEYVRH
jgi:hypothetical protein